MEIVEKELAQMLLYFFLGFTALELILLGILIVVAIVGIIYAIYRIFIYKRDYSDPVLYRQNAISGLTAIHKMLLEYLETKNETLKKVINNAIKNWNKNFSADIGVTLDPIP